MSDKRANFSSKLNKEPANFSKILTDDTDKFTFHASDEPMPIAQVDTPADFGDGLEKPDSDISSGIDTEPIDETIDNDNSDLASKLEKEPADYGDIIHDTDVDLDYNVVKDDAAYREELVKPDFHGFSEDARMEPADFGTNIRRPLPVWHTRFWAQHALPLVYDDSLSYMELLAKMQYYLNTYVTHLNETDQNVLELLKTYVLLQKYVNDQFDKFSDEYKEMEDWLNNRIQDFITVYGKLEDYVNGRFGDFVEVYNQLEDYVNTELEDAKQAYDLLEAYVNDKYAQTNEAFTNLETFVNNKFDNINTVYEALETFVNEKNADLVSKFGQLETYVNEFKTSVQTVYDELETYVNTFFETLDVQTEVNNAIDKLVENGQLEQWVEDYVNSLTKEELREIVTELVTEQVGELDTNLKALIQLKQDKFNVQKITITPEQWFNDEEQEIFTYTAIIAGIVEDEDKQLIIIVPTLDTRKNEDFQGAGLEPTQQLTGAITFECKGDEPQEAYTLYVLYTNVGEEELP